MLRHGFKTGKSLSWSGRLKSLSRGGERSFKTGSKAWAVKQALSPTKWPLSAPICGVLSPSFRPRQAEFFVRRRRLAGRQGGRVEYAVAKEAGRPGDLTREPWVFEFVKGETFHFPDETITTPRANRAIITMADPRPEAAFSLRYLPGFLAELGADLDVAFLAGYHQCGDRPDDLGRCAGVHRA